MGTLPPSLLQMLARLFISRLLTLGRKVALFLDMVTLSMLLSRRLRCVRLFYEADASKNYDRYSNNLPACG